LFNIKECNKTEFLDIQEPKIENTLSSRRKWRDVEVTEIAIYWTSQRSDDVIYEERQGV
jgi:hypothetical protein